MGMTRTAAASYLSGILTQLLTDAGLGNDDEVGELAEVIDDALLMTGTAYDDLATAEVASADVMGFRYVLTYAALLRIDTARGDRPSSISVSSPGVSKQWTRVASWKDKLDTARAAALPFITNSGAFEAGSTSLDYLEPLVTTDSLVIS